MQVLKQLPLFFPGHAVFTADGTKKPRPQKKPGEQPMKQPAPNLHPCPGLVMDKDVRKSHLLKEQLLLKHPQKAMLATAQNPADQLPWEVQNKEQYTKEQHMKELVMKEQQQEIQHGKAQRGFTLIEVLGALVVGSLVFGFAAFAISKAIESARVTSFNENLALLRINVHEVYASSRGFGSSSATAKDITETLTEAGAIPVPWLDKDSHTAMHTLGGEVSIEGTITGFTISAKGITQDACRKIASSQAENWDKITINGETVDTVPTTLCSSDDAGTGTNTMAFTAH